MCLKLREGVHRLKRGARGYVREEAAWAEGKKGARATPAAKGPLPWHSSP